MGYGSHIFSRVTVSIFFFEIVTDPTFFPDLGATKRSLKQLDVHYGMCTTNTCPGDKVVRMPKVIATLQCNVCPPCFKHFYESIAGNKIGPHQFLESYVSLRNSFVARMRSTVVSC